MWRLLWCLVAVLPWTIVGATGAGAETFYVSPGGDDTGRCELGHPCATFQRAFDVCPTGGSCGVVPAPGVYRQLTNVYYYKAISIAGEKDAEGHCVDRSKVIVEAAEDNGIGALFWVQDHAILIVSCLTLRGGRPGMIGFAARQFAIGDAFDIDFGDFPGGFAVTANETSKISVLWPDIRGSGKEFAAAGDLSQITIGRAKMADDLTFEVAFIGAATGAIVSVVEPIEGGERMSGASYSCDGAIIKKTGILPGGDKPYAPARPCLLMGAGLENAPSQYATRGDVDRVLGEIAGLRGAADATAQKLAVMLTEATQRQADEDHRLAEIEGRLARRQEERSQRLVALIAALGATVDKRYAAAERRRDLDDRSRAEADDRRRAETEQRFRDAADAMATLRADLRADTRQASMETEALRQDHAAAEADLRSRQRRDRTRIAFIGGGIILAVLAICALGYFRLWMELKRLMSGTSAPRH